MSIPATLTLSSATSNLWDVAIVGAGPAGSTIAIALAQRGRKVLLVDRSTFPRSKVCGCCLSGLALATLRDLGLGNLLDQLGAVPLHAVRLAAHQRSATLALPTGRALSRGSFDAALIQAAVEAGADFMPDTLALGLFPGKNCQEIAIRRETETVRVRASIVVVADGLNGRLLRDDPAYATLTTADSRIGFGAIAADAPDFFQPGTVYMACGKSGYVGLVRLEDGRLDIAAALDPDAIRNCQSAAHLAEGILASTGWPGIPDFLKLPWRGTPALTRSRVQRAGHRTFVVGDSAGYVEPFTGEGMGWAMSSALALSKIVDRAVERWDERWPRTWAKQYHRLNGMRQGRCRWVARLLRYPRCMGLLVGMLALAPGLARPYLRLMNFSGRELCLFRASLPSSTETVPR